MRGRRGGRRRRRRRQPAPALSPAASLPLAAGVRARVAPTAVVWLSPVVAGVVLAFPSGGYFVRDWGVASIILLAILAAVTIATNASFGGRAAVMALGGLGGLAAWQGLSSAWADQPYGAVSAMNLTLLYTAAFGLALVGVRGKSDLMGLLSAALGGAGVVTGFALASRLLPDLVGGDTNARLANPLSYWNGTGALVAFGAVLAVGLGGQRTLPWWGRAAAAALTPMFLLALLLTYSRGAALVLVVALCALIASSPGRLDVVASVLIAAALSTPLILFANAEDAVAGLSGALPPHAEEGRAVLFVLLLTMAGVAAATAVAAAGLGRVPARGRRVAGLAVACSVVVAVAAVLVGRMPSQGLTDWAGHQWDSFTTFDTSARAEAKSVADRLVVSAGSGRWQNWGAAADEFRESPVVGTGAGDYVFYWQERRDIELTVVNAHSLYLEILGETGIVGLLLVLLPLGAAGVAYVRWRPRAGDAAGPVSLALCAAGLVALHAAGDWDWQLPAIVLPAVAIGAGAVKVMSPGRRSEGAAAPLRWATAAAAILAIAMVAGPTLSATALSNARDRAAKGDLTAALARARDAARLAPQDPAPRLLEANLLTDLGRPTEADEAFAAAAARSPHDWQIFADWAVALAARGEDAAARTAAQRAHALNPLEQRPNYILERLDG